MAQLTKKNKATQGFVSSTIYYRDSRCVNSRDRALKVDVRRGETIDEQYAAALVAVRTGLPLGQVRIMEIIQSETI